MATHLGVRLARLEDERFLRGNGAYLTDQVLPGMLHMAILRSPHAHARIVSVDVASATGACGVRLVLTGADAEATGLGCLGSLLVLKRHDGSDMAQPPYPVLASVEVRCVGDAVALVVAETREQAEGAVERIEVKYAPLPFVTDAVEAASAGAPEVWPGVAPGNVCFNHAVGDKAGTGRAFAMAHRVVAADLRMSRVSANPIEPRGAIGVFDQADQSYCLYAGVQTAHSVRNALASQVLNVDAGSIRIISPDVGGAFGMKGGAYPEYAMVLWAARLVDCPVCWTPSRGESFQSDYHGRDQVVRARLALDEAGLILGLEVKTLASLGAYLGNRTAHSPVANLGGLSGVYRTPAIRAEITGVFTNTQPTAPYRGAGRPEAIYVIERLIDIAARESGMDRIDLRRRNIIPAAAMPYDTGFIYTYDSGDFAANMDLALEASCWETFEARRKAAFNRGMYRGIGLANAIEIAGGPVRAPLGETVTVGIDGRGLVTIGTGTHAQGQGHETAFRQIAADWLGVPPCAITLRQGDTGAVERGVGTFGSRSAQVFSTSLRAAIDSLAAQVLPEAAELLQSNAAGVLFDDGLFFVPGTGRSIHITDIARLAAPHTAGLFLASANVPAPPTFPCGCHVCEIEVDPQTGASQIVQYLVVEDAGTLINPMIVEGQIHGGIAQGLGQVMSEFIRYDPGSGQLVTASFMDYAMPRAADVPAIVILSNPTPARANPLGVKGVGEAGVVGSLSAVSNALADALAPLGIIHVEMPATPFRLWRVIQSARGARE